MGERVGVGGRSGPFASGGPLVKDRAVKVMEVLWGAVLGGVGWCSGRRTFK